MCSLRRKNWRSYKKNYEIKEALGILKDEAFRFLLDDEYVELLEKTLKIDQKEFADEKRG